MTDIPKPNAEKGPFSHREWYGLGWPGGDASLGGRVRFSWKRGSQQLHGKYNDAR